MEHVAFLIEESGALIRCMLNPETLVVRRLAGVRTRRPTSGRQTGSGQLDDLVFFTGGGRTELELDLLFDIDLPGSSLPAQNVRDLTGPIWQLAENSAQSRDTARPPQVRFLWGKAWNIPGVVLAIAERFESFTTTGIARRSWLRMILLRVSDVPRPDLSTQVWATPPSQHPLPTGEILSGLSDEPSRIHEPIGVTSPSEEKPSASLPGLVDPNALLAQALQRNPLALEALQETDDAINAFAVVVTKADLPPTVGAELNKAVQEMQAAMQSIAPGAATPSLATAAIQLGAAQVAANEALATLPSEHATVEAAKDTLNSLEPALNKLRLAQAEVAKDVQQSTATISASAAVQISNDTATALKQIESSAQPAAKPADIATTEPADISPPAGETPLPDDGELPETPEAAPVETETIAPDAEPADISPPTGETTPPDESELPEAPEATPVETEPITPESEPADISPPADEAIPPGEGELPEALKVTSVETEIKTPTAKPADISSSVGEIDLPDAEEASVPAAEAAIGLAALAAERPPDLTAAFNAITAAAEQIRDQGDVSQVDVVLERLDDIAPQLNTAWGQNNARPARHTLQALALASHNLQAAEVARKTISPGTLLTEIVADLRNCLESIITDQADVQPILLDVVRRLEAIARIVLEMSTPKLTLPDGRPENVAVLEIATQVRQGLQMLSQTEDNQVAVNSIQAALDSLDALVEDRLDAEAVQTAAQVRSVSVQDSSEVTSLSDELQAPSGRLDQIAFRYYGNPTYWRLLAQANQIDNPLRLTPNQPLVIPPNPRAQTK